MSLKAQLTSRKLPEAVHPMLLSDPSEATAKLQAAQRHLRNAEAKGDKSAIKTAKAAVTRAQRRVDDCYAHITLRALPPAEYEALIGDHPPTAEQLAAAGNDPHARPEWDDATFRPALLAVCADGDMTEADWTDFLAQHASKGEAEALFTIALAVNESARLPEALVLPKGSPGTGSSLSSLR